MATAKSFEELEVWRKARQLAGDVYRITDSGSFARDFGLRDQLRRAAVSVVSNIAEGFERGGNREFVHFLYMAKGSAAEMRAQLYVALDLGYLGQPEFALLADRAEGLSRQVAAFIKYLEGSPLQTRTRPATKSVRTSQARP
jgi:four helix bundle protein